VYCKVHTREVHTQQPSCDESQRMLGARKIFIGRCPALAVAITARSAAKVIIVVQPGLKVEVHAAMHGTKI
jgi:hypothetical protein